MSNVLHYFETERMPGATAVCGYVATLGIRADGHPVGKCQECVAIVAARQPKPVSLSGKPARTCNPRYAR